MYFFCWSTLAVSVAVYLCGVTAKLMLRIWVPANTPKSQRSTWFTLWSMTQELHPVAVGGLLGLIPWPWAPSFVAEWPWRVLWFANVGAVSGLVYGKSMRAVDTLVARVDALVRGDLPTRIERLHARVEAQRQRHDAQIVRERERHHEKAMARAARLATRWHGWPLGMWNDPSGTPISAALMSPIARARLRLGRFSRKLRQAWIAWRRPPALPSRSQGPYR